MVSIKEKDIRLIFKMKEVDIVELSKQNCLSLIRSQTTNCQKMKDIKSQILFFFLWKPKYQTVIFYLSCEYFNIAHPLHQKWVWYSKIINHFNVFKKLPFYFFHLFMSWKSKIFNCFSTLNVSKAIRILAANINTAWNKYLSVEKENI